jgi:subtilisin-like proprotein convertase family protein
VVQLGEISGVAVYLDITHTYIGDLLVQLTSPTGTTVILHNRTGTYEDDILGWYPTVLTPAQSLDAFLGEEMAGDWTLLVSDHASWDTGTVNEWCLELTFGEDLTGVGDDGFPQVLSLAANYPNPFNPQTSIRYELPRAGRVDLAVFDLSGRRITTLVAGQQPAGRHRVTWLGQGSDSRPVASGVYVYRLRAGGQTLTRKMTLLK